jgi:hypothetical protein
MKEHEIMNLPLGSGFRRFVVVSDLSNSGCLGLERLGHVIFISYSFMAFLGLVRSLPFARSLDAFRPCCWCSG